MQAEIESITQSIAQLKIQVCLFMSDHGTVREFAVREQRSSTANSQCENNDLANEIANVDVLTEECTQSRKEIASLQVRSFEDFVSV